jgi:hypothetical protein
MSRLAWYRNKGGVDCRRPDAYMDIKTDGTVNWDGQKDHGENFIPVASSRKLITSQAHFQMAMHSDLLSRRTLTRLTCQSIARLAGQVTASAP